MRTNRPTMGIYNKQKKDFYTCNVKENNSKLYKQKLKAKKVNTVDPASEKVLGNST